MDGELEWAPGVVVTVRVLDQPPRRYLVTSCRPTGEHSIPELELLADPGDEPSPHVWRRAP